VKTKLPFVAAVMDLPVHVPDHWRTYGGTRSSSGKY
jgi:hypothetical protein